VPSLRFGAGEAMRHVRCDACYHGPFFFTPGRSSWGIRKVRDMSLVAFDKIEYPLYELAWPGAEKKTGDRCRFGR
jgi:hypothetical protein